MWHGYGVSFAEPTIDGKSQFPLANPVAIS
jgi:hypothetical protein